MPDSTSPLLKVDDLAVHVRRKGSNSICHTLLSGCSFELHAAERLTLVGESGAGKSLLAQAIMGSLPHDLYATGGICIAGIETHGQRHATQALWGSTVIMLPQEPWLALSPLMRVQHQVAEAARYAAALSQEAAQARAQIHLQQVGLERVGSLWLHQISGGMAQRVGVACASAAQARLIIADEPTKGLDEVSRCQVADLLLQAQRQGQALLTITHDLQLAQQLGGRLAVMYKGQIVEQGLAHEVLTHPQHPYTQALVAAQPAHWPTLLPPTASSSKNTILQGHGLSKAYGSRILFDGLDLTLNRDEVVALAGPSGSGKTTLGNILLRLIKPDTGSVKWSHNLQRWRFQKLYQDPPAAFAPQRRVGDAITDMLRLHGLSGARTAMLLQDLRLDPVLLQRLPHQVSGGELQRLALLRLLLLPPAFIFADEPTSRLDAISQKDTMALLCQVAQQHECAILLVSHDQELAKKSSHRQIQLTL